MLTNAKNRNAVFITTLNPSLDFNLVEMIDAMEPKSMAPVIEAKTTRGMVSTLNSTDLKNIGYPIAVINPADTSPMIPIVYTFDKIYCARVNGPTRICSNIPCLLSFQIIIPEISVLFMMLNPIMPDAINAG